MGKGFWTEADKRPLRGKREEGRTGVRLRGNGLGRRQRWAVDGNTLVA